MQEKRWKEYWPTPHPLKGLIKNINTNTSTSCEIKESSKRET